MRRIGSLKKIRRTIYCFVPGCWNKPVTDRHQGYGRCEEHRYVSQPGVQDRQQLALPDAPHNGTPTSRAAASMVNVSPQEQMILTLLDRWPGLTQDKIADLTGLLRSAVAGRCNRLEYKELIKKDGTAPTKYGRPAAVYHRT